jgi:parallel beta-helix repeat protein
MNKGIVLGVVLLLIMMSFISISGNQINNQIIKSSDRGNILYVGGSGEGNYTTIQSAIDDASDGDTVFVYDDSSPYYERLIISKPLDLVGESRDSTIIDGNYQGNVVVIQSDFLTVSGFKIINCVMENETKSVIHILDSKNVVIKDNYISVGKNYSNKGIGIFIESSSHNLIQNNIIFKEDDEGLTRGISILEPSHHNNYSGNEIYGYNAGIRTERAGDNDDSNYNVIYKNNI